MIFFCKVKAEYYDVHFFDRHNHKLQEDFELFIALLERLMAEQIRKQSATAEAFNRLLYLANLQKKFQRENKVNCLILNFASHGVKTRY